MSGSIYMRLICALAMAAMCVARGVGQDAPPAEAFRVLAAGDAEGPQITQYLQYQTALAWDQDALRLQRWSRVKSESELLQLRGELKQSLLEMIGGLPTEKKDLHAEITGRVSGTGFHIEKLIYQSIPGFYVTALVYVPENGEKVHPAVLVPAGHSPDGKNHYVALCERLVQRGYLVISWDPVGQGERSQFWDAKEKKSRYNLGCGEHAVMGNLAYLAGANLARWEAWDGIRAVDYLLTRADVDGSRINITGTSGGGFQTTLIAALDERIKVIIPSCYITALPMRVENRIFADSENDPEQDLFGLISKGVDNAGMILAMYPRAVMVATATLDFFPVQGSHKSFMEVSNFYKRFGHGDRMEFAESYNRHEYSLKNQETALGFLDRFNKMPVRHGLPQVTAFSDDELRVTKSGQISVDYPEGRTLPKLIATYFAETSQGKKITLAELYKSENDPEIAAWKVSRYEGLSSSRELRWEALGGTTFGAVHIDRYSLHHSRYLAMPLLHIYGDGGHAKGAVLWVGLRSKASAGDWPQIVKLLNDGYEVFSFDFRGLGETRMNYRTNSSGDSSQTSIDEAYVDPLDSVLADYVANSLLTGRPYFLQMLDDLKIAELFIHHRSSGVEGEPLTVAASGDAYSLAVRFQEVDPSVSIVKEGSSPVLNWSALVAEGKEQWPIVYVMPSGGLIATK